MRPASNEALYVPLTHVQAKAHVDLVAWHASIQVRPASRRSSEAVYRRSSSEESTSNAIFSSQQPTQCRHLVHARQGEPRHAEDSRSCGFAGLRTRHACCAAAYSNALAQAHRAENLRSFWLRLRAAWMMMKLARACIGERVDPISIH